jgi:predicted transcriptional regulator
MAMSLRLPDELNEELRATAESEGRSMQQVAVTAISEYIQRREVNHVRKLTERFVERNRLLLDRLGDA